MQFSLPVWKNFKSYSFTLQQPSLNADRISCYSICPLDKPIKAFSSICSIVPACECSKMNVFSPLILLACVTVYLLSALLFFWRSTFLIWVHSINSTGKLRFTVPSKPWEKECIQMQCEFLWIEWPSNKCNVFTRAPAELHTRICRQEKKTS